MLHIGPYSIATPVILAPMAGVTDLPFRRLCLTMGAGMAVSEMVISNPKLWHTRKSRLRLDYGDEGEPRAVQIAGRDPEEMALAARLCQEQGAQIIDINMGCPARKVCSKAVGSALMKEPDRVERIIKAVVAAVTIPVTLKIRTGWDLQHKNGVEIARLAEASGIQALAVHGRTRACLYRGEAEYDTIARICQAVSIPVIANGDIDSPEKARAVLEHTGAQAVMIGRAAQGRPWIFREISHYLKYGEQQPGPSLEEVQTILLGHLQALYRFYGEHQGVRIARKHVGWYMQEQPSGQAFRQHFNTLTDAAEQIDCIQDFFNVLSVRMPFLSTPAAAETGRPTLHSP